MIRGLGTRTLLTLLAVGVFAPAAGAEPQDAPPPPESEATPNAGAAAEDFQGDGASDAQAPAEDPKKKKNVVRRKDAGSRAKERFQADTIPKSHYTLDGKPLSVDPD